MFINELYMIDTHNKNKLWINVILRWWIKLSTHYQQLWITFCIHKFIYRVKHNNLIKKNQAVQDFFEVIHKLHKYTQRTYPQQVNLCRTCL
ncbi:hypothetical protein BK137_13385 [Viridibacillus arenosi]|nr:hypothetical protein BK137_13385 [Viridibacillus arenosi]